jgi:hypothetical protein
MCFPVIFECVAAFYVLPLIIDPAETMTTAVFKERFVHDR